VYSFEVSLPKGTGGAKILKKMSGLVGTWASGGMLFGGQSFEFLALRLIRVEVKLSKIYMFMHFKRFQGYLS